MNHRPSMIKQKTAFRFEAAPTLCAGLCSKGLNPQRSRDGQIHPRLPWVWMLRDRHRERMLGRRAKCMQLQHLDASLASFCHPGSSTTHHPPMAKSAPPRHQNPSRRMQPSPIFSAASACLTGGSIGPVDAIRALSIHFVRRCPPKCHLLPPCPMSLVWSHPPSLCRI